MPSPRGNDFHSFCPDCNKVRYNLDKYGPVSPFDYNRVFCICAGKQTGMESKTVTVFDLEDVLTAAEARRERERQNSEQHST